MALSRSPSIPLLSVALLIASSTGAAQTALTPAEFSDRAAQLALQVSPAFSQGPEFGQVSLTFIPGRYKAADGTTLYLALLAPQMWVSPNLAIKGSLGIGSGGESLIQALRIAVVYIPETLGFIGMQPEVVLAQNRIDGLPAIVTAKWNEIQWRYKTELRGWQLSGGIIILFQRIFTRPDYSSDGNSFKLERTEQRIRFTFGKVLANRVVITGHLAVGGPLPVAGIQLGVAL